MFNAPMSNSIEQGQPDYICDGYDRLKVVGGIKELYNASFNPANVIIYPKPFSQTRINEFNELARGLARYAEDGLMAVGDPDRLKDYLKSLSLEERPEAKILLHDLKIFREHHKEAVLRVVKNGGYYEEAHVYKFHGDEAKNPVTGRSMRCYNPPTTLGIRNEDAELQYEDMYLARPGARIFSFRPGDIWRQAAISSPVQAFLHRAENRAELDDTPRMLMVGF
jgi:hypothetical protein